SFLCCFQRPSWLNTFSCAFSRIEQVLIRITSASDSSWVNSMPCDAFSTSAILAESYSFIWQPWVLMKSLPLMAWIPWFVGRALESAEPRSLPAWSRPCQQSAMADQVLAPTARNRQRALGVRGPWRHTAPMSGAASHRGSVDRPARCFPSRPILAGVVLLAACLYGGAARAGTLYQCTGSSGETVYSSSRAGYRACHAISSYAEPKARVRTRPRERTSLTGVAGTVATTARSLFADGSQPVSLAGVRGSVATTARAADAMPPAPRVSLARVRGSVETNARLPLAAAAAGTPGQW